METSKAIFRRPSFSEYWIMPGLLASMVFSQQEDWTFASIRIGYIFSTFTMLAAMFILFKLSRKKSWAMFFTMLLIGSILISLTAQFMMPYRGIVSLLYCLCGAYMSVVCFELIYKQMMYFCLFNVCFMLPQIMGVEWVQFLTTHGSRWSTPTLLVAESDLMPNVIQQRPAGLCYANIILSLIALFMISLHLPKQRGKMIWGTLVMSLMIVLAMAKIIFMGYFMVAAYLLVKGDSRQKRSVMLSFSLIMFFMFIYSISFPGLFAINLSDEAMMGSTFGRLFDIVDSLGADNILRIAVTSYSNYQPETEANPDAPTSGITLLIPYLPYLFLGMAIVTPFFMRKLNQIKKKYPNISKNTIPILISVGIYPLATPIWNAPIYWFMAGFAFVPLFYRKHWMPQTLNRERNAIRENQNNKKSLNGRLAQEAAG